MRRRKKEAKYGVVGGDEDAAGARGIEQIPDACPVAAEFAFAGVDRTFGLFSVYLDSEWPEREEAAW